MPRLRVVATLFAALALSAPVALAQEASPEASPSAQSGISSLSFVGEQQISNLTSVDFTLVGGLSGIDYDPVSNTWILISDDRSGNDLARFYTADVTIENGEFTSVAITGQTTLLEADGTPYEPANGDIAPDAESIRFDPANPGTLWWSTEADTYSGFESMIVQTDFSGNEVGQITPDPIFAIDQTGATGSVNNNGFEGLTMSADGESIWVINESAVIQDGPFSSVEAGTVSRLTQYDRTGNVLAQYAYEVDPIQAVPTGEGADNGVSELLAIDDTRFLVVERSGVSTAEGPWNLYIRIYMIDISGATDVSGVESLIGAEYTPVSKSLVLNLNDMGLPRVDNIEGIAWGPTLPSGNASLMLVSDNNFNPEQVTQFLLFEVIP